MSCAEGFQVTGLIMDIVGVVLVWKFGLLPRFDAEGGESVTVGSQSNDPARQVEAQRHRDLGRLGLAMLIAGFTLQLIGAVMG